MPTPLFTLVADAERQRARAQLDDDPIAATVASTRRHDAAHDELLAHVGARLACRRGCAWCCHFRVAVRPHEALRLADAVRNLPEHEGRGVVARMWRNLDALAAAPQERHARLNLACPLLQGGACLAWEARPHACRAFHATESGGCEAAYDAPDADVPDAFVPPLRELSAAHEAGLLAALADAGFETRWYDLNEGLALALEPDALDLWREGFPLDADPDADLDDDAPQ